jgi:prepilin-type N-terminal cleavage/methylation domain-containing protein
MGLAARRGFSLIEVLICIAIIAVLVSILMPALSRARESSRQAVCGSNVRQLLVGFTTYAGDYKVVPGTYLQGSLELDWCGRGNASYAESPESYRHPFDASPLSEYVGRTERVLTCPAAGSSPARWFDYTMVVRMAGARLDLQWRETYPLEPRSPQSARRDLPGLILLVEEHERFHNAANDNGAFEGDDQFATRHGSRATPGGGGAGGGGTIGYLDGAVAMFRPPAGANGSVAKDSDLTAAHLRLHKATAEGYPVNASSADEFGWVNGTR